MYFKVSFKHTINSKFFLSVLNKSLGSKAQVLIGFSEYVCLLDQ